MNRKTIGLMMLSCSCITQAGTMGPIMPIWQTVVTASGGPAWGNRASFQTVYFSPELSRSYTVENSTHLFGEGEIFAGRQRILNKTYEAQLGLAFTGLSSRKISGEIWDFEDSRFNNYQYTYKTRHYRGVVKGKFLANNEDHRTKPWISASIGLSYNKALNYKEWPVICEAESVPAAFFQNKKHTALTYSLGAGIQRALTPNWQLGIGYEFTDWGRTSLGAAAAQPAGSIGLTVNHLYTNGVLLNLTWLS